MRVTQQRVLAQASAQGTVHARCQALGLARSSYYYKPRGETPWNLTLMHLLDEEFTRHNFKGVRGLRGHLRTGLQDKREARAPPRAPHRPGVGLS